jgi:hypothetical protein
MKTIFFLLLFPTITFASPSLPVGKWSFDRIEALQEKTIERIDPRFPSGKERLAELRKNGIACVYKLANLVECSWFEKNPVLEPTLYEKNVEEFSKAEILVSPLHSSELTNEGDYLKEYLVNQKVVWAGNTFLSYRWLKSPDFQKAVISGDNFRINPKVFC